MARGRPPAAGTVKKTGRAKSENKGEIISAEQWAKMKSFGTFVVSDPDTGEAAYKFKRGDVAAVLPHGRDPSGALELSDYWVGVIKDIRAELLEDDLNTVWAKVIWYYSGKDIKGVVKSFDQSAVGKYERIEAEHEDIVGSESFESVLHLIGFNERDPEQAFIPRDQFYRRYSFELRARTIKPKPGSSGCTCLKPYNPNDMDPASVMHFCPRPSCRRAYHQSCLIKAKSVEPTRTVSKAFTSSQQPTRSSRRSARKHASPVKKPLPTRTRSKVTFEEPESQPTASTSTATASRALRLLACSPDTDDSVDLESLVPLKIVSAGASGLRRNIGADEENDSDTVVAQPPKKKRRGPGRPSTRKVSSSSQAQAQIQEPRSLSSVLSEIPSDLLEIAQQPMIRGGAFVRGGVSGNIGFVTRARRSVYKILEGERNVAEMLERVDVPLNYSVNVSKGKGTSTSGIANGGDGGGSLIMLKWEEEVFGADRQAGLDVDEENAIVRIAGSRKALPALVCPQCKSAI